MRVLVVRHHLEDSAGLIGEAFEASGATLFTHLFPGDGPLPSLSDFDRVVILGAAWSIYDERSVGGFLGEEIALVHEAERRRLPVLGICFGAQLLTTAFGGRVERSPVSEIGWVPVESLAPKLVGEGPWFQFHHDRCLLADGAEVLARNDVCIQAFRVGRHLGVQFHPEIEAVQLQGWLDFGGREEAIEAGADPDALVAETISREDEARKRAQELVDSHLEFFTR